MIRVKDLPKVELHLHLDGSLDIGLASKILNKDRAIIEEEMIAPLKCKSLGDYLERFRLPEILLQKPEHIEAFSKKLADDLIKENVVYAEVRFAPNKHLKYLDDDSLINLIYDSLNYRSELKVKLILSMMRNDSYLDNIRVINLAYRHLGNEVAAVDLAGDEDKYPTILFKDLFDYVKELKIPFTIHAGESTNANEVLTAINFGAKRIGHGIKVINDQDILNILKENDVLLELAPSSNVQTNSIDIYKNHPIKRLKEENVIFSINTDNRTVSNLDLTSEYIRLIKSNLLDINDIIYANFNAIDYSFLNKEDKKKLLKIYSNRFKLAKKKDN